MGRSRSFYQVLTARKKGNALSIERRSLRGQFYGLIVAYLPEYFYCRKKKTWKTHPLTGTMDQRDKHRPSDWPKSRRSRNRHTINVEYTAFDDFSAYSPAPCGSSSDGEKQDKRSPSPARSRGSGQRREIVGNRGSFGWAFYPSNIPASPL